MTYQNGNAPTAANGRGARNSGERFHVQTATAEPLLQRLEGVQKSGNGWRARCPGCAGQSRKLSVTEVEGRVLVHCFGGCGAIDVLQAVGLGWPDIMPPRHWPESPEERRRARQAMREAAAVAAIDVLAVEAAVIRLASQQVQRLQALTAEDSERLALACHRIENASYALTRNELWRHPSAYTEAGLVSMRRGAVQKLRRELEEAERAMTEAEAALAEMKKRKEAA